MKKCFLILLLLFTIPVFGQEVIRDTVNDYLKVTEERDFEGILDRMYPKFFELAPRDLMLNVLKQSFNDPSFNIELKDSEILAISDMKKADSVAYYKVSYSFLMLMQYVESEDEPFPDKETIRLTQDAFSEMYGKENVSFDEVKMRFSMKAKKEMLVLKTDNQQEWKVLGIEANLKPLLKRILPKKIVEEL